MWGTAPAAARAWWASHKCRTFPAPRLHGSVFAWPTTAGHDLLEAYATLVLAEGCNAVTLERLGALLVSLKAVRSRARVFVMTDAEQGSDVHAQLIKVASAFGAELAFVPSINGARDRES